MISDVKAYARARLNALGYKEWRDGFNFENIPRTLLDKSYCVELGVAVGLKDTQDSLDIDAPFTVRIFMKPRRESKGLIDEAIERADEIIFDLMAAVNRVTGTGGLKNIRFDTMTIEPLKDSNDNGVIAKITFAAHVIIPTR